MLHRACASVSAIEKLGRLALSLVCALLLTMSASARAAQTILYYFSEPGDYIGQGAEATFTDTDGAFSVAPTYNNGMTVAFHTPDYSHWWYLNLAAANGADLQPGAYENSERWPFESVGHPGLDFSGDGRGCNQSTGRFDVLEIVRDASGNIIQFAANWEQHCEGFQPALFGQVRVNSSVPLSGKPLHINLENPLNPRGCVEATGPNGAQITVDALGIVDSTGGNAVGFTWSTSNGHTGAGPTFTFAAPLNEAFSNPVVATLTVTDRTNNTQRSVTKSICVSDTTPPVIVINKPLPGTTVKDDIDLDVTIHDTVDKNITKYEIQIGRFFVSDIDPKTGRSKQHIFNGAKPDGTITTSIIVRAHDASGNVAEQAVTVNQIKK